MASEAPYFSHDYNARNDLKMQRLRQDMGVAGIGIFWCLIEIMYEEGGEIDKSAFPSIAKNLKIHLKTLEKVVQNFGLFQGNSGKVDGNSGKVDGNSGKVWSNSVKVRLNKRKQRENSAKIAANIRWSGTKSNADAMRTECEPNAIKGKEIKEKEKETFASNGNGEVFKLYENNIGALTPFISEKIGSLVDDYGETWVCEAIGKATAAEKRNLNYVEGILKGWKRDGKGIKNARGDPGVWNVH